MKWLGATAIAVASCTPAAARPAQDDSARPAPVDLERVDRLVMECGRAEPMPDGGFAFRTPCVRAVAAEGFARSARLAFRYGGPTERVEPLASGELRRQIGLKLRARDTCNVVYVMWHLAPAPGIHVSVKSNPGQSDHAACGDRGYINLPPTVTDLPPVRPGEGHTLSARIEGSMLTVQVDDAVVWQKELPSEALGFDGPVGIRADNVEFDARLWAR